MDGEHRRHFSVTSFVQGLPAAIMHRRIDLGRTVHDETGPGVGLIILQSVVPTIDRGETEDTAGACHRHGPIGDFVNEMIAIVLIGVLRLPSTEIVGQNLITVPQDADPSLPTTMIGELKDDTCPPNVVNEASRDQYCHRKQAH
jgi:hypothetical protein